MMMDFTARDVLDDLDDDARQRGAFFPDLDSGYDYHVDQRLTAYADRTQWVIVIEQLSVNPRSWGVGGVHTNLYYHGTGIVLPPQPGWAKAAVQSLTVIENGAGEPLLQSGCSEEINLSATDIRIRGKSALI